MISTGGLQKVFEGPVKTASFEPFIVSSIGNIRALCNNIKKLRHDIFCDLGLYAEDKEQSKD